MRSWVALLIGGGGGGLSTIAALASALGTARRANRERLHGDRREAHASLLDVLEGPLNEGTFGAITAHVLTSFPEWKERQQAVRSLVRQVDLVSNPLVSQAAHRSAHALGISTMPRVGNLRLEDILRLHRAARRSVDIYRAAAAREVQGRPPGPRVRWDLHIDRMRWWWLMRQVDRPPQRRTRAWRGARRPG
jgi:hypothetical protein